MRIDRRDFLKLSAGAAYVIAKPVDAASVVIDTLGPKENEPMSLEEAFTQPVELFEKVLQGFEGKDKLEYPEQELIAMFGQNSKDQERVRRNQDVLMGVANIMGQELGALARNIRQTKMEKFFNFPRTFIDPILNLHDIHTGKTGVIRQDTITDLQNLINWSAIFYYKKEYTPQKLAYLQLADGAVEGSSLIKDFSKNWSDMRRYGEVLGDTETRDRQAQEALSVIIGEVRRFFPGAFYGMENIDFTSDNRAYFNAYRSRGFFTNADIFAGFVDKLDDFNQEKGDKKKLKGQSCLSELNDVLHTMWHETGHRWDINQYSGFLPIYIHPKDFVDYNNAYADFFKRFNAILVGSKEDGYKGLSGIDIEQIFDEGNFFPRQFGVDQIATEEDGAVQYGLPEFVNECEMMKGVCHQLGRLKNGKQIVREIGMDYLFRRNNPGKFRFWQEKLTPGYLDNGRLKRTNNRLQSLINGDYRDDIDIKDVSAKLTRLGEISTDSLDELITLTKAIATSRDLEPEVMKKKGINTDLEVKYGLLWDLVEIKSIYFFSTYLMLEKLAAKGLIDQAKNPELYYYREFFADKVHSHIGHVLVGPVGQYIQDHGAPNVFKNQIPQVVEALGSSQSGNWRKNYERVAYGRYLNNPDANELVGFLNWQVLMAQDLRANMWTYSGPSYKTGVGLEKIAACNRAIAEKLGVPYEQYGWDISVE